MDFLSNYAGGGIGVRFRRTGLPDVAVAAAAPAAAAADAAADSPFRKLIGC